MAPRSNISAQQAGHPAQAAWPAPEVDQYGRPIDPRWAQQAAQHGQAYAPVGHQADAQGAHGYAEQQGYAAPGYAPHGYAPQHGYQGQPDYPTAPPQQYADPHAGHQGYGQASYAGQVGAPPHQPQSFSDAYAQASAHNARQAAQTHYEAFNAQPAHPGQHYEQFDPQLSVDPQAQAYAQQQPQHGHYDPRQAYEPSLPNAVTAPPSGYGAQHGHHPHELQAHDHLAHDPAAHGAHLQSDPRNWDLSHYPPPGGHAGHGAPMGYAADPHAGHHDPRFAQPQHVPATGHGWPQQQGHQQGYADAGYEAAHQHHLGHGGQHQPTFGAPMPGAQPGYEPTAAENDVEEGDDTEAPRRPKAMLVVGALIGAIALGGGLAYGYKRFVATAGVAKVPVVSAPKAPTRVPPTDPGGKDLPYTDKRFLNKHDEKGGPAQTGQIPPAAGPQTPADAEAPRKVTTVIVNKDGSITPAAAAPAPPPPPVIQSGVPGMVIEGVTPPQPRPELRGAAPPERAAPPVTPVQKAPAQPKVADLPLPKVKNEARPDAATPPPPKKKPAVRDDLVSQQTGAPAAQPPSAAGANGHVVVMTSRKSREDALKSFADLQQKYGEVIGSRPMDVREVNLGEKGVWYRSIVGPPGSKEAARALCKQLSEKGFKDCFTMAY